MSVDERRLVDWAASAVSIPSFTGEEQAMAEWIAAELRGLGCAVQVIAVAIDHVPGSEAYPVGTALEAIGELARELADRAEGLVGEVRAEARAAAGGPG